MRRTSDKIEGFLQEFREEAFKLGAREVLLFGSAVDGSWHEGSDLDIVVFAEKPCKRRLYEVFWRLDEKYGTNIRNVKCMHPPVIVLEKAWMHRAFNSLLHNTFFMRFFALMDRVQERLKRFALTYSQAYKI